MITELIWLLDSVKIDMAGEKDLPVCFLAIADTGHPMAVVMSGDGLKLVSAYLPAVRWVWLDYLNNKFFGDMREKERPFHEQDH